MCVCVRAFVLLLKPTVKRNKKIIIIINGLSTNLHLYKSMSSLCVFSLLLSHCSIEFQVIVRIFAVLSMLPPSLLSSSSLLLWIIQRISGGGKHEHEHRQITSILSEQAPESGTGNCCWTGNYFYISTNYNVWRLNLCSGRLTKRTANTNQFKRIHTHTQQRVDQQSNGSLHIYRYIFSFRFVRHRHSHTVWCGIINELLLC